MAQHIQLRRDLKANWTAANPTLAQGEFGYELDTGDMKIGDGATAWNALGYYIIGPGATTLDPLEDAAVILTANEQAAFGASTTKQYGGILESLAGTGGMTQRVFANSGAAIPVYSLNVYCGDEPAGNLAEVNCAMHDGAGGLTPFLTCTLWNLSNNGASKFSVQADGSAFHSVLGLAATHSIAAGFTNSYVGADYSNVGLYLPFTVGGVEVGRFTVEALNAAATESDLIFKVAGSLAVAGLREKFRIKGTGKTIWTKQGANPWADAVMRAAFGLQDYEFLSVNYSSDAEGGSIFTTARNTDGNPVCRFNCYQGADTGSGNGGLFVNLAIYDGAGGLQAAGNDTPIIVAANNSNDVFNVNGRGDVLSAGYIQSGPLGSSLLQTTVPYPLYLQQPGTSGALFEMGVLFNYVANPADATTTALTFAQRRNGSTAAVKGARISHVAVGAWTNVAATQVANLDFSVIYQGTLAKKMRIMSTGNQVEYVPAAYAQLTADEMTAFSVTDGAQRMSRYSDNGYWFVSSVPALSVPLAGENHLAYLGTDPATASYNFDSAKHDGAGGLADIDNASKIFRTANNTAERFSILGTGLATITTTGAAATITTAFSLVNSYVGADYTDVGSEQKFVINSTDAAAIKAIATNVGATLADLVFFTYASTAPAGNLEKARITNDGYIILSKKGTNPWTDANLKAAYAVADNQYSKINWNSNSSAGATFHGYSKTAATVGLTLRSYMPSDLTSSPALALKASKHDGAGVLTDFAATSTIISGQNDSGQVFGIMGGGDVCSQYLSGGLFTGDEVTAFSVPDIPNQGVLRLQIAHAAAHSGIISYAAAANVPDYGLRFQAYCGLNPTTAVYGLSCYKHDGAGALTTIADGTLLFTIDNTGDKFSVYGNGNTWTPGFIGCGWTVGAPTMFSAAYPIDVRQAGFSGIDNTFVKITDINGSLASDTLSSLVFDMYDQVALAASEMGRMQIGTVADWVLAATNHAYYQVKLARAGTVAKKFKIDSQGGLYDFASAVLWDANHQTSYVLADDELSLFYKRLTLSDAAGAGGVSTNCYAGGGQYSEQRNFFNDAETDGLVTWAYYKADGAGARTTFADGTKVWKVFNNVTEIYALFGDGSTAMPVDANTYIGNPTVDGCWRIRVNGTDLEFDRREAGVFVNKGSFAA